MTINYDHQVDSFMDEHGSDQPQIYTVLIFFYMSTWWRIIPLLPKYRPKRTLVLILKSIRTRSLR